MTDVTDFQKDLIYTLYTIRGRIVGSFAQIEFFLADLSVKINEKFPYKLKNRLSAARQIASRPDFAPYREELLAICTSLEEFEEMRHFMAHGYTDFTFDKADNHLIRIRMYQTVQGNLQRTEIETNQFILATAAERVNKCTQRALALFRKIYGDLGLETADAF